jgi:hypothetical protein
MMNDMMSGGGGLTMWGMGFFWLLVFVVLVLRSGGARQAPLLRPSPETG